ncbi:MAG: beta-ketoacyl synthase chain length factor [Sneathiella sp.]|nr:beta-ketoacyl synthase chain length factor [Sneathiella sp.]
MANGIFFSLDSWSAWAPELDSPAAWRDWALADRDIPDAEAMPDIRDLPAGLRRRLSKLGKIALRVAMDIETEGSPRVVFSSRNGNVTQMLSLLQSLAAGEPVSPAGFGMSVHNSLAGMLSIITGNREAHTAIAAGGESLCMGLLEALMLLEEDPSEPVLLVHCDETLPEFYAPFQDPSVPVCSVAMLLRAAGPEAETLSFGFTGQPTERHEGDPLTSFLRFLLRSETDWSWTGAQGNWWCQKHG